MNINSILTSFWSSIKAYLGNNYLGKTAKAESAKSADSVTWDNVSDKPSTYMPSSHTHDDRYYTETEIDTKLNSKANTSDLSTVATSGSYNDLSDKPTIPTKISDLTNDSGFVIDVSGKADKATTLSGYGITDAYTKTQVDNKISGLVNSAPETLDTLNELASALGNDPNFATTVANQIGTKANDSDVVHKSGNESISGQKTFTSLFSKSNNLERGTLPSTQISEDPIFISVDKNNRRTLAFYNYYYTSGDGRIVLYAYNQNTTDFDNIGLAFNFSNTNNSKSIFPINQNTYYLGTTSNKWKDVNTVLLNGKTPAYADDLTSKANDSDVVHKSGDETISGIKTFSNTQTYFGRDVCCYSNAKYGKNLNPTTTSYQYVFFNGNKFSDGTTDNWYSGYLEQVVNTDGSSRGRWLIRDTSENTVGIELWASGDNKQIRPYQNNNTNLGDSGRKFKDVYATTFHGDVDFPITEAQVNEILGIS